MKQHPFIEKYNPANYQPAVYNFVKDFSHEELKNINPIEDIGDKSQAQEFFRQVADLVSKKYDFLKLQQDRLSLDSEQIEQKRQISCYGFTIATSQLLNELSVPHRIAFANTHSFVIANSGADNYLVDSLTPKITGEIDKQTICHSDCFEHGLFALDFERYLKQLPLFVDIDRFIIENEWASFYNANRYINDTRFWALGNKKKTTLHVRTYDPGEGTRLLYAYDQYRYEVSQKHYSKAYYLSLVLGDKYPDVDARNRPYPAEALIVGLGKLGLSNLASKTIDRTAVGRQVQNTIGSYIWQVNQYKKLFNVTNDPSYLKKAHAIIEELLNGAYLKPSQRQLLYNYKKLLTDI